MVDSIAAMHFKYFVLALWWLFVIRMGPKAPKSLFNELICNGNETLCCFVSMVVAEGRAHDNTSLLLNNGSFRDWQYWCSNISVQH